MNTVRERIDVQSHVLSPEFLAFLEKRAEPPHIVTQNGARTPIVNGCRRFVLPKILHIGVWKMIKS